MRGGNNGTLHKRRCYAVTIVFRLDRMMVEHKISLLELAEQVGITNANLSRIKNGKVDALRVSTLDAICRALHCQPGDILEHVDLNDDADGKAAGRAAAAPKRTDAF